MQLFASYARRDATTVQELIGDLARAHLSVWHDQELRGGDPWWQNILRRIRECDVFLFVLSKNSLTSKPCLAELSYARALGLPILPVQNGSVGNLRTTPVADLQVVDYRERTLASGLALMGAIQALSKDRRPLPDPLPEPPVVPFAYLVRLGSAIGSAELTPMQQGDLIRQLRECLETEEDEGVKEDARELLRALRSRPDVAYRSVQQIDQLLAQLEGSTGTDPPSAGSTDTDPSSAGSAGTDPPSAESTDTGPSSAGSAGTNWSSAGFASTDPPSAGSTGTVPSSAGSTGTGYPSAGATDTIPPSAGSTGTKPPSAGSTGTDRKVGRRRRTWLVVGTITIVLAFVAVVVLRVSLGAGSPSPPGYLGSDSRLDGLAQSCYEGNLQACDDLYYESAVGSAYEDYGATCGGRYGNRPDGGCG